LGGTAVLAAAGRIPEVRAVATVNAPSDPSALVQLLGESAAEIARTGFARVSIGGRQFNIRRQLLDDSLEHETRRTVATLRRPLLIFHAPDDPIVSVEHARRIYQAAQHPKSFVALDGAGHLLTRPADGEYVGQVLAVWASRYVLTQVEPEAPLADPGEVVVAETGAGKYHQTVAVGHHRLQADEPVDVGGDDRGPSPYGLLLAGLGACTSMTLRMYAAHKGLALPPLEVRLRHSKVAADQCPDCETQQGKVDVIEREITVRGELTDAQRERLLQIADRCPVHRTLHSEVVVRTRLRE